MAACAQGEYRAETRVEDTARKHFGDFGDGGEAALVGALPGGAAGDGAVGHRRASVRRGVDHQEEGQEGMLFILFYLFDILTHHF